MNSAPPITISTAKEEINDKITKKEIILKFNNFEYKLIISSDNNYLYFKIEHIYEIIFYSYQTKYDLKTILNTLMLNNILYDNFEKIVELINDAYINNKLFIKDIDKSKIELIIKLPIGYKEYDCSLILNKEALDINKKFEIILKQLGNNKDNNEIKKLEKYLIDLKSLIENKLNENTKLINLLKEKDEQNKKEIKKNKEEIDNLKNEIIKYKNEILNSINDNNEVEKKNVKDDKLNNEENLNNLIKEKDKEINELKNEIEKIKKCEDYNVNKINNKINDLKNNELKKFKENGKKYNLKELEFINNRCKKCDKTTISSIYKCVICDNYFLCETCYKTNKNHEHIEFFHIIYPNGVKKEIDNKKLNNAVNAFYGLLNKYFFDKNGNIIVKEINNKEIGKIKQNLNKICKDMINVNVYPLEYFSAYQKSYINIAMKNMEEKDKDIVTKNVIIFTNNINK